MSNFEALARSASSGSKEDMYTLLTQIIKPQFDLLNAATGNNMLAPTNSPQQPSAPPPPQASLSVAGANGNFTASITPAPMNVSTTLYHEVSYSPVKSFTSGVTTLPPSTATSVTVPAPGSTMYFRVRSSADQNNWNNYSVASNTPASAGLQSSAATSNAVALNQSNYANVDSVASGATATVQVYGSGGPGTSWVGLKGTAETVQPSATVVNVTPSSTQIVGLTSNQYTLSPTLPGIFSDDTTPVGQVSVVDTGPAVMPTVVPIEVSGAIVGYNVTAPGNGLSGDLTLTVVGAGTGATTGEQVIQGGQLISVAPGNVGMNYTDTTTVTVSGGLSPGVTGGGTITGNNGGRLTALQGS